MAGINSQIVHIGNGLKDIRRRLFLKELSHELVLGELVRRSQKQSGIPLPLQERLKRFRPNAPEEDDENDEEPRKKRRCVPCTSETGIRRLSRYECQKCKISLCLQHSKFICTTCFSNADVQHNNDLT